MVIDNNSGTYSPSKDLLPLVIQVFKANFPDMEVEAFDRENPRLIEYMKDCVKWKVIKLFEFIAKIIQ